MTKFKTPPLKRHPSLQPFSRDHYVGLVHGRHLMKAADGNAVDRRGALAAFLDAWHQEIAVHFDDEERMIAHLADQTGRTRLVDEHNRIRALVEQAADRRRHTDPGASWVRTLGEALTEHIRWEERDLFPALEAAAAGALDDLKPQADELEASRPRGRGDDRSDADDHPS